ncbi:hypothetical protein Poly41_01550 [Novipirellula artificiosorum]|uniref:Uncharacterized protein n=1 Tax=Novipirellula artificiosorum TaxID=2528016 RepID=A0A5C6DZ66_9BACT|nr:hypothetical protein Poly41_01550 [Novipirellula artificiosorum]
MSVTIPDRAASYSRRVALETIRVSGVWNLSNSATQSEKALSRRYKWFDYTRRRRCGCIAGRGFNSRRLHQGHLSQMT